MRKKSNIWTSGKKYMDLICPTILKFVFSIHNQKCKQKIIHSLNKQKSNGNFLSCKSVSWR